MKITNAMSLLELQNLLREQTLAVKVDFVNSARAWRATLQRSGEGKLWIGIGRSIGEAFQDAYAKYEGGA